jgi:hypothetical protein
MEPDDIDDFELDTDTQDWAEDMADLDWDEAEARSVARELGIVTSEL